MARIHDKEEREELKARCLADVVDVPVLTYEQQKEVADILCETFDNCRSRIAEHAELLRAGFGLAVTR